MLAYIAARVSSSTTSRELIQNSAGAGKWLLRRKLRINRKVGFHGETRRVYWPQAHLLGGN
jgi:hypothetical protein